MAKIRKKLKKAKGSPYALVRGAPSAWNFWEEGVSSSLLGLWLSCREQFRLEVVEGWRPQSTPYYFAFGTCVHWCLEQVYGTMKAPPNAKQCKKLVAQFEKLWKSERPNPPRAQLELQEKVYGLAEAVLPAYFTRWAGDFLGHTYPVKHNTTSPRRWVGLESRFRVPFTFPDGKQTWIVGTRDGVVLGKKDEVRIFDTKCRSVIDEDETIDLLPFDLQQMLYLWVTWQEMNQCPSGTLMNILRRPGHRQGKSETSKEFFARVAKEVADPRKWDHFFLRVEMDVSKDEVQEFHDEVLLPLMLDLRAWVEGTAPHYKNPNALTSKYGKCAMYAGIVHNNFSGYSKRKPGTIMSYQTDIA